MARQRKGLPVHGWLILDKPQGMTSTQAVSKVKRLFEANKAGHAGTLDPLATGVLPIALGEATKTVPFVVDGSKEYRFTVRFGAETDTDDTEGKIIVQSERRPSRAGIDDNLTRFTGEIEQVPPRYSALRVDGARAYDLARDEERFELAPRRVTIEWLRLIEHPDNDRCVLEARCGKGTYIRALARDLGRALGSYGHVEALRRTRVGPFAEDRAVTLAALEACAEQGGHEALVAALAPVEASLCGIPPLALSRPDADRLRRGQPVLLRGRDAPVIQGAVYVTERGILVALGEVERGELKPKRIFNLPPRNGGAHRREA
jgi:tRNA pseudouridine55 synthase